MEDNQISQIEDKATNPSFQGSTLKRLLTKLPKQYLMPIKHSFSELTLSQWMYLFAFLLLLLHIDKDFEKESELLWVGLLAGIGLIRELWHVFNRIWDHMLGKGLILVMYAATANFALAISALKINVITGIEPSPFVFTLAFTTLIMLPFWLLVSSIIFFSVALIASNLWLLIGILLRLVRIKIKVHWEDKRFVFVTLLLRIVLIPYVIMSIFFLAIPYAQQIELFEQSIAMLKAGSNETSAPTNTDQKVGDVDEVAAKDKNLQLTINQQPFSIPIDKDGNIKWLDKLIAGFVYHFETYPKSACKKRPIERSLPIDENSVLLVAEDDSALGYHFWVAHCDGDYAIQSQLTENQE